MACLQHYRPPLTIAWLGSGNPFLSSASYKNYTDDNECESDEYPDKAAQTEVILDILSHGCSQELTADKSRLDEVNDEAVRLIAEGHTGEQIISEQQDSLNARWNTYAMTLYCEMLEPVYDSVGPRV